MPSTGKSVVLVQRFMVRTARNGDDYAAMKVNLGRDASFSDIDAKIWKIGRMTQARRPLPEAGSLIEADYTAEEYQGMPQWSIREFRIIEGPERDRLLEKFVQPPKVERGLYEARLAALMAEVPAERAIGQILKQVWERPGFREAFLGAPAAVAHHQNYPGGLLEHTINVTSVALAIADVYSAGGLTFNAEKIAIDRPLLIAAGLLHDIGKVETYRFAPLSTGTDANVFEGHLAIGYAVAREAARPLREAPPYDGAIDEIDKLLNCILSHHGSLEFGSPVLPASAEAFILSQADLTDARLASIATEGLGLLRQTPAARWLRHAHFPQGMFVGDWKRGGQGDGK